MNTELHEKTIGIENKNGLELYRLIYNSVDALPENAEFHMDCALTALPQQHAMGIKNLMDLYGFRLLLKKKVAEYKTIVGQEPEHKKLGEILWSCMDVASKQLASQTGLDKKKTGEDGK